MKIFKANVEHVVMALSIGVNTFNGMKKMYNISSASLSNAIDSLVKGEYVVKEEGKYSLTVKGYGLYSLIKEHYERTGN